MPGIGHLAVGLAGGRIGRPAGRMRYLVWLVLLVGASYAPDLDVLAFRLGNRGGSTFGHRGATHSVLVGVLLGSIVGLAGCRLGVRRGAALATALVVAVSHGVLDAFTNGGRGVALWWPFSGDRVFAPWRPIPVSPIGLDVFGPRGLLVLAKEIVLFLPLFVLAVWPVRRARRVER